MINKTRTRDEKEIDRNWAIRNEMKAKARSKALDKSKRITTKNK